MKRFAVPAAAALLFLLAFAFGLARHFPGAAVTRAIESAVNQASPMIAMEIAPVRLGLTGLRSDSLIVREAGPGRAPPLFALRDLRVGLGPSLWRGAPVQARLGTDGQVSGFVAWNASVVDLDSFSARLEDLPLPGLPPGVTVQGRVTLSGHFESPHPQRGIPPLLPEGTLVGRLENVEVKGIKLANTALPVTRLQELDVRLGLGRTVRIERFEARGDLQGTVQGTITPNLLRVQDTGLNLTVAAAVRGAWLQETGALRPILEGFLPGGRIEGVLSGTVRSPTWAPKGAR